MKDFNALKLQCILTESLVKRKRIVTKKIEYILETTIPITE